MTIRHFWHKISAYCGIKDMPAGRYTTVVSEVTCKRCQRFMRPRVITKNTYYTQRVRMKHQNRRQESNVMTKFLRNVTEELKNGTV